MRIFSLLLCVTSVTAQPEVSGSIKLHERKEEDGIHEHVSVEGGVVLGINPAPQREIKTVEKLHNPSPHSAPSPAPAGKPNLDKTLPAPHRSPTPSFHDKMEMEREKKKHPSPEFQNAPSPGNGVEKSNTCAATCKGYSCDHWKYNDCNQLEELFGCDCSGCSCDGGKCQSAYSDQGDSDSPQCQPFCGNEMSMYESCQWCKCKGCQFCLDGVEPPKRTAKTGGRQTKFKFKAESDFKIDSAVVVTTAFTAIIVAVAAFV